MNECCGVLHERIRSGYKSSKQPKPLRRKSISGPCFHSSDNPVHRFTGRLETMQFVKYTVIRLGIFLAVFLGLWLGMKWPIFVSGIIGLVVAFAVAYLFFNKLRLKANEDIRNAFNKTSANKTRMQLADEAVEDEFDESQRKQAPGAE
ncbi:DUF4229 domain-containing protein [Glutamicibacter sp. Je.9.36]|uniref:DUF4229 domain-containing protein n=1 Tax=Glutamicibacter sp. Je.9.36 TaxID=3142837 RepID=UPI003DA9B42C